MTAYDVSREDLMAELKRDLEAGKPLASGAYKVRAYKMMDKEEFSEIRKELKVTQAHLAEILDISIKTVQAYEQGRAEVPGLVSKVLRLMRQDPVFQGLFRGEMTTGEYSSYVSMKSVIEGNNDEQSTMKLAKSVVAAVEEYRAEKATNEIESMTAIQDFIVLNNQ
jgi:DNA-binding transcriptional regulator YiaG